jgi:hypothetical protein
LRHAVEKPSLVAGQAREWASWGGDDYALVDGEVSESPVEASLDVWEPFENAGSGFVSALSDHDNRYAYIGDVLRRTSVRFAWEAVAFAEIRDLNRHRTGTKFCPLSPVGFYYALDQLPPTWQSVPPRFSEHSPSEQAYFMSEATGSYQEYVALEHVGRTASLRVHPAGELTSIYFALLGTQFPFEHTTTADKFIYEAELRTGTGSHYRYAEHLRDALALWYERYPQTRGLILEGSAEPE